MLKLLVPAPTANLATPGNSSSQLMWVQGAPLRSSPGGRLTALQALSGASVRPGRGTATRWRQGRRAGAGSHDPCRWCVRRSRWIICPLRQLAHRPQRIEREQHRVAAPAWPRPRTRRSSEGPPGTPGCRCSTPVWQKPVRLENSRTISELRLCLRDRLDGRAELNLLNFY